MRSPAHPPGLFDETESHPRKSAFRKVAVLLIRYRVVPRKVIAAAIKTMMVKTDEAKN